MNREKRAPILGAIIGIIFSAAALGFLATPSSAATTSSAVSSADPGVLPAGYTQAEMDTDIAVDGFVQDILAKYGDTLQPSVDWGTSTILLAVKAPIPSELSALSGTSVAGLGVKVQEAKYSPADFDAIVAATGELSKAVPGLDQVEFYSMPADGSRIEAKVSNLDSLASSVETSLTSTLQKATGANIALVSGPMLTKNFSRQNDDDPWIGGGMMREANGGYCSTGFAVLDGVYGRLLSAGHCGANGASTVWKDGTNSQTLTNGNNNRKTGEGLDSLLIDPVGGTNGVVYGGDWDATSSDTSRYRMSVSGAGSSFIGEHVCTSGANTGEHCALTVVDSANVPCDSVGTCHRWIAENYLGNAAAGPGDSGGPVYANTSSDHVGARGIIKQGAIANAPSCGSQRFNGGPCAVGVMFVGIRDILGYWNVNIETN